MIIDECELLFSANSENDARGSCFNLLLLELEKVQKSRKRIYVFGATNRYKIYPQQS